jgi:hypothetical protein
MITNGFAKPTSGFNKTLQSNVIVTNGNTTTNKSDENMGVGGQVFKAVVSQNHPESNSIMSGGNQP